MSRNLLAYFLPTEHRRLNEFIGLLLATVAILIGLSLISFNPDDPSFNISRNPQFDSKPANFIGILGSYVADGFFQVFGYSSFLLPIFLGVYAFYWLASWPVKSMVIRFTGMLLLILTLSAALSIPPSLPKIGGQVPAGGLLGRFLAESLDATVNPTGSAIILLSAFLVSLFLATTFSFSWAMSILKPRFAFVGAWSERYNHWREQRALAKAKRKFEAKKASRKQVIITSKEPPPEPAPVKAPEMFPRPKPAPQPAVTPIRLKSQPTTSRRFHRSPVQSSIHGTAASADCSRQSR